MADAAFWKRRYRATWPAASRREREIIARVQSEAGRVAVPVGLGTGSADYLAGSAARHGHERGAADLRVRGSNIYLEVTGPLTADVPPDAPLWLRPDKLAHARSHLGDRETWVVHCLGTTDLLRVIRLDVGFFALLDQGAFRTVTPTIRGTPETYLEIPAAHPCVQPWAVLVERLQQLEPERRGLLRRLFDWLVRWLR
jgi:hypothetical protein